MRLVTSLVLLGSLTACGGPLFYTSKSTSLATPDEVYQCVQTQLKSMRYFRAQYDTDSRWFVGQKVDTANTVSSGNFRRTMNRIDAKVQPDATGATSLELKVQTFNEFGTAAGTQSDERKASAGVKRDAATLAEVCGR
jgi:hypothetical protein